MQFKPAVLVIHTMKRMQGGCGSVSNSSSSSRSSKYQDVHSQASTRCRRKPTTHGRQYAWQTFPVAPKSFSNSFSTPMTSHTTAKAAAQMFNEAGALGASVTLTPAVTAPGAGHGPAPAQLARQFRDLLKHPIPGVSAAPDDEDPMMWHVRVSLLPLGVPVPLHHNHGSTARQCHQCTTLDGHPYELSLMCWHGHGINSK